MPDGNRLYDLGIPQGWGPGPWDVSDHWWNLAHGEAFYGSGDIRLWRPGDPLRGARLPITMHRAPVEVA